MDDQLEMVDESDEPEPETEKLLSNITQAVVYNTDWTVETVLRQLSRKNIEMPEFQRRDAWQRTRKSKYIESLLLGLPIPQIVLAEKRGERGSFLVLDGKQRLLSLLQFVGDDADSPNNSFRLQGLEVLTMLNGMNKPEIEQDEKLKNILKPFDNQAIRSVLIKNWPSTEFLYMLFTRLNSGSLPLSPQELRQALFPGAFTKWVEKAAGESLGIRKLLELNAPDSRMRDVELLVRYYAFAFFLSSHPGSLKRFLDETCEKLNVDWERDREQVKNQLKEFELAINASIKVFDGVCNVGRKWTGTDFSSRLNRAILDVILFYFSDKDIRALSIAHRTKVMREFKLLCAEEPDFITSVESTTKSIPATFTRLSLWGSRLRGAIDANFTLPELKKHRIVFDKFWK